MWTILALIQLTWYDPSNVSTSLDEIFHPCLYTELGMTARCQHAGSIAIFLTYLQIEPDENKKAYHQTMRA
ncbi:hypothetical protein KDW_31730 [Dictyobacter vulcani]|uniref:Uncharacterized protein n=1 Tax=Dictyobacter vulcani TaxID=2607529 RepID=A0A5J4KRF1_9CHLR|nr:hypothetical protein KDW_31730 [Dictyobacter vulcani]